MGRPTWQEVLAREKKGQKRGRARMKLSKGGVAPTPLIESPSSSIVSQGSLSGKPPGDSPFSPRQYLNTPQG